MPLSLEQQKVLKVFQELRWWRLPIVLRNIRNVHAREHPLSVLHCVCKSAAIRCDMILPWFMHPHESFGHRINKGRLYSFDLIFTANSDIAEEQVEKQVADFRESLRLRLQDQKNNFEVLNFGEVERRCLSDLPRIIDSEKCSEICLDFLTPLPFRLQDKKRRWLLSNEKLFGLFRNRLKTLFDIDCTPLADLFSSVTLLTSHWKYFETRHKSRSDGKYQYINGMVGPLYIKGELSGLLPLLQLGSELHLGRRLSAAQGCYRLKQRRPCFDELISRNDLANHAWQQMQENTDAAEGLPDDLHTLERLHQKALTGEFRHHPVQCFPVKKKDGFRRLIGSPEARDAFVHKLLALCLTPAFDKMFEHSSVGFRRGRSPRTAFLEIEKASREGFLWVLESDVTAFFDSVDLDLLWQKLENCLPEADELMRTLLRECLHAPRLIKDREIPSQGLLQGSPLSPLLANLYLDSFDEAIESAGYRLIRFADDFVILTKSQEDAEKALELVKKELLALHLTIKEEKTGILPLSDGFRFLGKEIRPGAMFDRAVARESLKKPLFVSRQYCFIGLDYDSIVIKDHGKLIERFPMGRIGEIIILGSSSISTALMRRCARVGIPVSFCNSSGYYESTARPDSRHQLERLSRHSRRYDEASESDLLEIARSVVRSRVENSLHWIKSRWPPASSEVVASCRAHIVNLAEAESLEAIRGYEGAAAKRLFHFVNSRVAEPAFKSKRRQPHLKPDCWNSLLDFLYYLLFTRLNVLIRTQGLNPYLGFLHSPKDNFESLVCDFQEPFRYAMERLALNLVNLRQIKECDFKVSGMASAYWLTRSAMKTLILAFEKELAGKRAGDPGSLLCLISAQVRLLKEWVEDDVSLEIWKSHQQQ